MTDHMPEEERVEAAEEAVYRSQETAGRLAEAEGFPRVVLLDTVSYCNLRCSMCVHRDMTRKKGFMPWPLFTKIIDEIAAVNPAARVWMVFFGEALIRRRKSPTIFEMIAYAKKQGLTDVVMNSNGNLLGAEDAKKLIGSGLDAVYFGIDAARAETYERIRVGGNFQRTVDNIRGLVRLKKEMGADTPEVCVQFVEMDENEAEKGEFIDFWNQEGVKVKIRPKVSWAGMIDAPNLLLGNEERWPCHWAMQTLSVTDQGLVVTCAVDLDARLVAGDLNRQTIKEVWNGTLRDLRRLHLSGDYVSLPPHCRDCRDWQSARADYYQANP